MPPDFARAPQRRALVFALASASALACSMPNPEFDETRDELGGTAEGDGDGDPPTGDGDGDPSTGDGDGDPSTGDGDGDGDPSTGDGDPSTGDGDGDPTGDGDGDPPACEPGLEPCNGACVDLDWDYDNCGLCGSPCVGAQQCGFGECVPKRYVFVSTHLFAGNFGGSANANTKCNDLASMAQIPGTYRAWLTDDEQVPVEVFEPGPAAYVLRNGPVVAWSWDDLVDGQLLAPINRNEFGDPIQPSPAEECQLDYAVWTGTTNAGLAGEPSCATWANNVDGYQGLVGNAQSSEAWSDSGCAAACDLHLPVYCVQVTD